MLQSEADYLSEHAYKAFIENYPGCLSYTCPKIADIFSVIREANDIEVQAAIDSLIFDFNDYPHLSGVLSQLGEEYYKLAFRYKKDGLDTEAKDCFRKAAGIWKRVIWELSPSAFGIHAYYFTGVCYYRMADYERAIEYFEKLVTDWPHYMYGWSAQYLRGICYERLKMAGLVEESQADAQIEQAYKAVVEEHADYGLVGPAALKLARLYFRKGQWFDAAMYYELFLQDYADDRSRPDVLYNLAQCCEHLGDSGAAVVFYQQFLQAAEACDNRREPAEAKIAILSGAGD